MTAVVPVHRKSRRTYKNYIFLVFSLLFLPVTIFLVNEEWNFIHSSAVVQGTVVGFHASGYHPEVAFVTRTGEPLSMGLSSAGNTQIGDKVPIRYSLARPSTAQIDTFINLWALPLVFGIFTILCLYVGCVWEDAEEGKNADK